MIQTCVIGSYPVVVDNSYLMSGYFDQKPVVWDDVISSAVDDMVNAGLDFVSDGQTRDPFIQLFTRKISGCRIRDRTEIVGKLRYSGPIIVDDQVFVKQKIPESCGLIGVLTGPWTLTQSCVDLFYNDEEKLAFDFAKVLHEEAKSLEKTVDLISIDEPFFSNVFPDYAKELIETVTDGLSCSTRLHVCGDVSSIASCLVDMPVDILSHEFKLTPKLFDVFKDLSFDKKICLGSVRSDDTCVESVDEIIQHVNKGINVFDEKIVQISPDCGMRMLPRDVAFQKLKNLSDAGGIING